MYTFAHRNAHTVRQRDSHTRLRKMCVKVNTTPLSEDISFFIVVKTPAVTRTRELSIFSSFFLDRGVDNFQLLCILDWQKQS